MVSFRISLVLIGFDIYTETDRVRAAEAIGMAKANLSPYLAQHLCQCLAWENIISALQLITSEQGRVLFHRGSINIQLVVRDRRICRRQRCDLWLDRVPCRLTHFLPCRRVVVSDLAARSTTKWYNAGSLSRVSLLNSNTTALR